MLRSLWAYRGFVLGSVKREFQSKYRNSLLGMGWSVINPLAMIVVYTVIFSQVMKAKLPGLDTTFAYSIYLCSGVLTWGLFSEMMTRSQNLFLDNANLLKKINFPRIILPIVVVFSSVLNFSIVSSLFIFWFWLTPVVYPASILPDAIKPYLSLNPMAVIIESYQTIFVNQKWPDWSSLWPTILLALTLGLLGMHLVRKNVGEMVDEL